MNSLHRWPLHPAPCEGEALSAWLNRVAMCYEMDLEELLRYEWGNGKITDLDIRPPDGFLETIAGRSGYELDTLRCMTMAGWVPWLLDSFDFDDNAFNCYVTQFSVLLPQKNRPKRIIPGWRAWLPKQNLDRACPVCINKSSGKSILKLMWQFPLFVSCPVHGCWLEPCICLAGKFYGWENKALKPRPADSFIRKMDHYTQQAFITGHVELPRRSIHAGLWFRLLRTLIDELNTPLSNWGAHSRILRMIWEKCGYAVRAGQAYWYPFEILDASIQLQFLEAAGMAINMIETESINAKGRFAYLFLPEPESDTYDGKHKPSLNQNSDVDYVNHWKIVQEELEKFIALARVDPEAADNLFHFILFGRRDPKVVQDVKNILSAAGVPEEWCHIKEI